MDGAARPGLVERASERCGRPISMRRARAFPRWNTASTFQRSAVAAKSEELTQSIRDLFLRTKGQCGCPPTPATVTNSSVDFGLRLPRATSRSNVLKQAAMARTNAPSRRFPVTMGFPQQQIIARKGRDIRAQPLARAEIALSSLGPRSTCKVSGSRLLVYNGCQDSRFGQP